MSMDRCERHPDEYDEPNNGLYCHPCTKAHVKFLIKEADLAIEDLFTKAEIRAAAKRQGGVS